jgi:hypothetical protein
MKRPRLRTAVACFAAVSLCWASRRLIQNSKRWDATDSETVHDLPGDELVPQGRSTTYAISIAAPPDGVWPWLVQIGRGRAASTPTPLLSGSLAPISTIWIGSIPTRRL